MARTVAAPSAALSIVMRANGNVYENALPSIDKIFRLLAEWMK
jgi:hypothetical protein